MSNRDQQEFEELRVFSEFATVCPLPLLPNTATKLPERKHVPDILCKVESGDSLAFELVNCEDVTKDDSHPDGFSSVMPKRLNDKMALENALGLAYRETFAEGCIDQPDRFKFHSVSVRLEDGFPSKNGRTTVAKKVIKLLNAKGPGCHGINDGTIQALRCEPLPDNLQIEGPPSFHISSCCGARVYIFERIKKKLTMTYLSQHPIHLLAWSSTADTTEFEFTKERTKLVEWLQSNGRGPFDRVWIFGYGNKSIVFDSANVAQSTYG